MGWFQKATGIKTPKVFKKAGEVLGKTTMIGQASDFAKENPGLTAAALGALAIPGVAGAVGSAGNSVLGSLGIGSGAAGGGSGGAGGILGGIGSGLGNGLGNALGMGLLGAGAGALNYEQINRGLQAHEGMLNPFLQSDPTKQAMDNMGKFRGSAADQLWGGTQFGGQGARDWLSPMLGNMAGSNIANQELRGFQNQDILGQAAASTSPGFDAALKVRQDAIQRAAAAKGLRNSGNVLSQLGDDAMKFRMEDYQNQVNNLSNQQKFNYGVGTDIAGARLGDVNRDVDIAGRIGSAYDQGYGIGGQQRIGLFNNFNNNLMQGWQDQLSLADRIGGLRASRDYARGGIATGALNSFMGAAGIPFGFGRNGSQQQPQQQQQGWPGVPYLYQ